MHSRLAGQAKQTRGERQMLDLCITGGRVVLPSGVEETDVGIQAGKIARIGPIDKKEARCIMNANGQYVFPGAVDTHVHFSEPGRTEWEGFFTGSRSLAAGGTTTYVEMPLNALPATTNRANLQRKLEAAKGQNYVDYSFYGGLVPTNLHELADLSAGGVVAFKCFLSPCGSDIPGDFRNVDLNGLRAGMRLLAEKGQLLCVHAEDPSMISQLEAKLLSPVGADAYVASRPVEAEVKAVCDTLAAARETGCRIHFVHISSAAAIEAIERAKEEGVDVTVESCPHYFLLSAEELAELGPLAKCQPPLRPKQEQAKLWACLLDGQIDWLASDHSPCTPDLKDGDFLTAWGGISGCQNNIDIMFDAAVKRRGMPPEQLARLIATNPAKRMNLREKGEIAIGKDADFAFVDDRQSYTLTKEQLYYKNKHSPYVGRTIGCKVRRVLLRGQTIYTEEKGIIGKPSGELLHIH